MYPLKGVVGKPEKCFALAFTLKTIVSNPPEKGMVIKQEFRPRL